MQSSGKPTQDLLNRVGRRTSQTPSRPASNIGSKRVWSSPLTRSAASPGHSSQMQRLFREARATLQLDATILSSPVCSIASRLPDLGEKSHVRPRAESTDLIPTDWRYSTAPLRIAGDEVDVREPFTAAARPGSMVKSHDGTPVMEPVSSGFNSPTTARGAVNSFGGGLEVHAPNLPPIPSSDDNWSAASRAPSTVSNEKVEALDRVTDLEQPMTQMKIDPVQTWLASVETENAVDEALARSDAATCHSAGAPPSSDRSDVDMNYWDSPKDIVLSTPARAAADSAKLKRDLLGDGVWASRKQPRRTPRAQDAGRARGCHTPTANLLTVPTVQITPSPDFPHGSPPPRATYAKRRPPPNLRRVDSRGSPFPLLKYKPVAQEDLVQDQSSRHLIPNPERCASPVRGDASPYRRPPLGMIEQGWLHPTDARPSFDEAFESYPGYAPSPHQVPDSQQMIHLNAPPVRSPPRGPQYPWLEKPFYSFSTAASASAGTSVAPDSMIRDSYRTDTLTPFEQPTVRYRKIGLGAALQKGARQGSNGHAKRRPSISRANTGNRMGPVGGEPRAGSRRYYANTQSRRQGPRTPQGVVFRSSPPRPAESIFSPPRRKRPRRLVDTADTLPSMTEEDELQHPHDPRRTASGKTRVSDESSQNQVNTESSAVNGDRASERVTVRETMIAQPRQHMHQTPSYRSQSAQLQDTAEMESLELSPSVTPYRKGRGPKERRPSFWDEDILGRRSGDHDKENKPPMEDLSALPDVDML